MINRLRALALLLSASAALAQEATTGKQPSVDLSEDSYPTIGEALGRAGETIDEWVDRFEVYGFLATRFMDTASAGRHPDGFFGIHQALLFVEADVRDVATAFIEIEFDYFRENDPNGTGVNEIYIQIDDICGCGEECGFLGVKAGRFNLPFGEYYNNEDADVNRLISIPVPMPYRWDEGVMLFGSFPTSGFVVALTEGSYDRSASNGISPAVTARVHYEPSSSFYLSASTHYARDTAQSALCLGGSVITPVGGGAAGVSPSSTIDVLVGSVDLKWQPSSSLHLQASIGGGRVDDADDAFDREFGWWIVEPSWTFNDRWQAALRWSGISTFDSQEGYQFEGRPYLNGVATYGFDQMRTQRLALAATHTLASGLLAKLEVGFDHVVATDLSGLPNATRQFVAAELVLSF